VIEGFVIGDDFTVEATITEVPAGDPLAKVWLSVKRREDDADAAAVFSKSVTTSSSSSGQITDTGADGSGVARFTLVPADTVLLIGEKIYYFDVQAKTQAGLVYTPIKGTIMGKKQITIATS
jgi:hypothetical protein